MCRAVVPARDNSMAQFQAHTWIAPNIANVSCFHSVLCYDPELRTDAPVAHRRTPRLAALTTHSFQKPISWWRNAHCEQKFDRQLEEIFLYQMTNPMFLLPVLTRK